jgi:predicted peptidase
MPSLAARGALAGTAVALLLAAAAPAPAEDQKAATGFLTKTFKNADGTASPYVLFVPHAYDGKTAYPVILFLHGSGETKGGSKQPVEVGIGPAIKKQEKTFPFITLIPQAETKGWGADGPNAKRALAMLDEVAKEYKTDPKRVYLTGLSMGGAGTWSLAAAHPEKWAAIVPICGGGDPATAPKIKDIPCWCFVGDKDSERTVTGLKTMTHALKAAGGKPKFTVYPGVPHNSWDAAYAEKELFPWLLEQKKK